MMRQPALGFTSGIWRMVVRRIWYAVSSLIHHPLQMIRRRYNITSSPRFGFPLPQMTFCVPGRCVLVCARQHRLRLWSDAAFAFIEQLRHNESWSHSDLVEGMTILDEYFAKHAAVTMQKLFWIRVALNMDALMNEDEECWWIKSEAIWNRAL